MYISTTIMLTHIHQMDIRHHLKREYKYNYWRNFPCKCYKNVLLSQAKGYLLKAKKGQKVVEGFCKVNRYEMYCNIVKS